MECFMSRRPATDEISTLTPLMFQVLVALSQGERHGYAIMQDIEERTEGAFTVGAGSLYRAIKQLENAGFIAEVERKVTDHPQRRHYRLTRTGRCRAAKEARVFGSIVDWAREAQLFEAPEA
jgi:DNA-binding PadR family transcriptional regulator